MTLEPRVELKLLGIIGDPDSGLCLRKELRGREPGDQLVEVIVQVPEASTPELQRLAKRMAETGN